MHTSQTTSPAEVQANSDWRSLLLERLEQCVTPHKGWSYAQAGPASPEPIALCAIALTGAGRAAPMVASALDTLATLQHESGAVSATADAPHAGWPTALALLAWTRCDADGERSFKTPSSKAVAHLLRSRGRNAAVNPRLFDHDGTIPGWPWVEGAGAWIEPTAYAVLALRSVGLGDHERVRDGVRMILDRALPEGGWNYGNRRVIDHVLSPFPAPTGIALAALAGEPRDEHVERAIAYLHTALQRVRTPLSLGWGLIGLHVWNATPPRAEKWLRESAIDHLSRPPAPYLDALLSLAGEKRCLLVEAGRSRPACVSTA